MDGVVFFCSGIWARKFWSAFFGSRFRPPQVFWNLAHREVFQHVYMFKQKLKFKEYLYKVYLQFAAVWAGYFAFRMERCRCPRSNLTWSRPRGSWVCHVLTILTHQMYAPKFYWEMRQWDNPERAISACGWEKSGWESSTGECSKCDLLRQGTSQHLWDNGAACLQRPGKFFDEAWVQFSDTWMEYWVFVSMCIHIVLWYSRLFSMVFGLNLCTNEFSPQGSRWWCAATALLRGSCTNVQTDAMTTDDVLVLRLCLEALHG